MQPNDVGVLRMITPRIYENLASHPIGERIPVYNYDGTFKYDFPRTNGVDRCISLPWWQLQRALLDDPADTIEIINDASVIRLDHFSDHVQIKYVTNRPRPSQMTHGNWGQDWKVDSARPSEEHSVYGRVVIGADGIRSQFQQKIYRAIGGDNLYWDDEGCCICRRDTCRG